MFGRGSLPVLDGSSRKNPSDTVLQGLPGSGCDEARRCPGPNGVQAVLQGVVDERGQDGQDGQHRECPHDPFRPAPYSGHHQADGQREELGVREHDASPYEFAARDAAQAKHEPSTGSVPSRIWPL